MTLRIFWCWLTGAAGSFILLVFSLVASAVLGLSAAQADWISSYRQYETALEAGDNSAAIQHARDAWRLSSEALPP
ncbi:MAG: hypothetical protein AAF225_01880 [Pseudomonadota bacterium]